MDAASPTKATTFVVLLGASDWPKYPDLGQSKAFSASADALRDYFGPKWFNLPEEGHMCDLFDKSWEAGRQIDAVGKFVAEIPGVLAADFPDAPPKTADLLVYYIGHGEWVTTTGRNARLSETYHLLPRCAHSGPGMLRLTSFPILSIYDAIAHCGISLRRYLILDACFAAGSMVVLQSAPGKEIQKEVYERAKAIQKEVYERAKEVFPTTGLALLCSSSRENKSRVMPGENRTMFSGALLEVLTGFVKFKHAPKRDRWSLFEVGELTERWIKDKYKGDAIQPEVHVPDQSEGSIATKVKLFPNPHRTARKIYGPRRASKARDVEAVYLPTHYFPDDMEVIRDFAVQYISDTIAPAERLRGWHRVNPCIFKVLVEKTRTGPKGFTFSYSVRGYFSTRPITERAAELLESGELDGGDMAPEHIVPPTQKPHAVYIGGVAAADWKDRGAILEHLHEEVSSYRNQGVKVFYTTPVTKVGEKLARDSGFAPVLPPSEKPHGVWRLIYPD